MSRVRTDNVFGTVSDAPLTDSATTLNSAGLANLAAVSSAEAIITLDPNRVSGAPEIIRVTAHTGSATSATIVRGQFGTVAREHAAGTEWVHGPIASDSTTFADDADDQGDFVPMGAWQAYTPSNTNITVGNGTQTAFYTRLGRLVAVRYRLVWGSTTAFGGTIRIGLPVTAAAGSQLGSAYQLDSGTREYIANCEVGRSSVTSMGVISTEGTGLTNSTSPFTWTTNDELAASITYEAAS